jgi:hypothetical protein
MKILSAVLSIAASLGGANAQAADDVELASHHATNTIDLRALTGSSTLFANGFEDCPLPIFDIPSASLPNPIALTGVITNWTAVFGRPFPGLQGDQAVAALAGGQYIAVAFQVPTGSFSPDRVLQGVISGTSAGQTKATIAISECPGVVRQTALCTSFEGDPSLGLTVPSASFPLSSTRCQLQPGRVYYLNIANRVCDAQDCATLITTQTTTN